MSIEQMSAVWKRANVGSQGELLVLLALADWANDDGWCWPSIPTIAEKSRLSERQVRRILKQLEQQKKITIEEHRGRNNTNRYKLNLTLCPVFLDIKPDICDIENLTFATQKPDICDIPIRKNRQEPSIEPSMPDWIPLEPWNGFVEMRKRIRRELTSRGVQLIIGKLEKLRASGQDAGAVLDQSTEHSWQGVFEVRNGQERGSISGQCSKHPNGGRTPRGNCWECTYP